MKIDREKFLAALLAAGMSSAVGCGGEPPAAEAAPEETTGAEAMEAPAPEEPEMPTEEALPEEEPEVDEAGPTPE